MEEHRQDGAREILNRWLAGTASLRLTSISGDSEELRGGVKRRGFQTEVTGSAKALGWGLPVLELPNQVREGVRERTGSCNEVSGGKISLHMEKGTLGFALGGVCSVFQISVFTVSRRTETYRATIQSQQLLTSVSFVVDVHTHTHRHTWTDIHTYIHILIHTHTLMFYLKHYITVLLNVWGCIL